jgi:hypothetical protein
MGTDVRCCNLTWRWRLLDVHWLFGASLSRMGLDPGRLVPEPDHVDKTVWKLSSTLEQQPELHRQQKSSTRLIVRHVIEGIDITRGM